MRRGFQRAALLVVLAVAAIIAPLRPSGGAFAQSVSRSVNPLTWSKTVEHLDWRTASHVTAREYHKYVLKHRPAGTFTGYRTITHQRSPHVRIITRWPRFVVPAPTFSSGHGQVINQWASIILAASHATGVPALTLAGLIWVESTGQPSVVSSGGAIGLTQLEPATAASVGVNPWDPAQNVLGGARYLASLIAGCGGSLACGLASYNGGPGNPQYGYAAAVEQASY